MNTVLLKLNLKFRNLITREEGQDLVENALLLALIGVGAVAVLSGIGNSIVNALTAINSAL